MTVRHLGLRAQIVLSLAALLVVVFGFTAMALLWVLRASLSSQQRDLGAAAAEVMVQGVARRISSGASEAETERELEAVLGRAGILAIGVLDTQGAIVFQRSLDDVELRLGDINPRPPRPFQMVRATANGGGEEMVMVHPIGSGRGVVIAVVSLSVNPGELSRIARPLLIYLFTSGVLLLGFGYVALTNLIVRPLEGLTRATELVAAGSFNVKVPVKGGREIATAATAFNVMTRRLREQKSKLERQLAELEAATGELKDTQEQLIRSARLASVGSLAAGVAHEVGNPIAAIMGLAELMSEGGIEAEEEQEYLERIRRESERVNRIIRDLLEYSRPRLEQDEGAGSVTDAVDAAVGLLSPQKTFREVEVTVSVDHDLPLIRPGTDQLTQVLVNLLLNAADAMDGQGRVLLSAKRSPKKRAAVSVEVLDSGPGVPEENLERIFEPFYTTKEPGMGTGLGLALCEGIISRAGGSVNVSNVEGGGLSIKLELEADISSLST